MHKSLDEFKIRPDLTTGFHGNRLKHHWGEGKAASSFGPDRIRTFVSMATYSSHMVILGKTVSSHFLNCLCPQL